eukprot:TRINITY_DN114393_c0_g1_i1.p1 TRINITY_DN114393_c0_g1~~TRINITY_DN114393_c0_g1_i1.p1  ORF type:complete len:399 (-),score=73.63 TRINITY_DN114393_c0_g1_i1:60-1256(-)
MPSFGGSFLRTDRYDEACELGEDQGLLGPDMETGAMGPGDENLIRGSQTTFNQSRYTDVYSDDVAWDAIPTQHDDDVSPSSRSRPSRQRASKKDWAIFTVGVTMLTTCVLGSAALFRDRNSADVTAVANKDSLSTGVDVMQNIASGLGKLTEIADDGKKMIADAKDNYHNLESTAKASLGNDKSTELAAADVDTEEKTVEATLMAQSNLHDGNICADDEELFGTLCYKKCADLTSGGYPLRNGPGSCCNAKRLDQCSAQHISMTHKVCGGYEVSGDKEGKSGCPNPPGSCLSNEEAYMGECYKKCSYLTKGAFPFRSGPDSCCKIDPTKNGLACFFGALNKQAKTDLSLGVGGGAGDGNPSTPNTPHAPLLSLTEQAAAPTNLGPLATALVDPMKKPA